MRCFAIHLSLLVAILAASCDHKSQAAIPARQPEVADRHGPDVGQRDKEGKLVIMNLGSSGYAVLETDYALVFLNVGNEERPKRRYDFSSRESGYENFGNLEGLAKRLERIPPPRIVDFYSTCGAPPWYGRVQHFFCKSPNHQQPGNLADGA